MRVVINPSSADNLNKHILTLFQNRYNYAYTLDFINNPKHIENENF